MKKISFQYRTGFVFSSPVSDHKFSLKILPKSDGRQHIISLKSQVEPVGTLWVSRDGLGNDALSGFIDEPHNSFSFGITGTAKISGEPIVPCLGTPRAFVYPSKLTKPGGGLFDFYSLIKSTAPSDAVQRIQRFSHAVHERLRYERGVTDNSTSARDAFDLGAGVCQDYAHILLALLRLDKIPCRYVTGFASDYGETHAWVEAWANGDYYGIDPTRDKFIDEGYVALSRGRDFEDCSVERGIYKGFCLGTQQVNLSMEVMQ